MKTIVQNPLPGIANLSFIKIFKHPTFIKKKQIQWIFKHHFHFPLNPPRNHIRVHETNFALSHSTKYGLLYKQVNFATDLLS